MRLPAGCPWIRALLTANCGGASSVAGGGRMKIEKDHAEILGVRHGLTLGSPLTLLIENKDWPNWTDVMSSEPRDIARKSAA